MTKPILDQNGFPKINLRNLDYLADGDSGDIYYTNKQSETRRISFNPHTQTFHWVPCHYEVKSVQTGGGKSNSRKRTTNENDKNDKNDKNDEDEEFEQSVRQKFLKEKDFSSEQLTTKQALLVFLLLREQGKRHRALRKLEEAARKAEEAGKLSTEQIADDGSLAETKENESDASPIIVEEDKTYQAVEKKNFFSKNRQGGCYYGLMGGSPYTKTTLFRKFSCVNQYEMTMSGIVNHDNQVTIFSGPAFSNGLCKLLTEGSTELLQKRNQLERSLLYFFKGYLSSNKITASGSFVLQINNYVFLLSFNTPLETAVFWVDEQVFPGEIVNAGDVYIRSFSTDEIPSLDHYSIVLGSEAFWQDNRVGLLDSLWKLIIGDENLEQLIGQTDEYEKIAICQKLVEKTSSKDTYKDRDISVIYAQIPSTKSIEK